MKQKFTVTGMTCSACSAHVDKAVRRLDGVTDVNVNLLGGSMTVDWDGALTPEEIVAAVEKAGYGASLPAAAGPGAAQAKPAASAMEEDLKSMKVRLIASFVFFIPLFYLSMGHMMGMPIPHFFHGTANAMTYALTLFLLTVPIMVINQKYYRVGHPYRYLPRADLWHAVSGSAQPLCHSHNPSVQRTSRQFSGTGPHGARILLLESWSNSIPKQPSPERWHSHVGH